MRLVELKKINDKQLDETHPMTRMMLRAMGEKDPEKAIAAAMGKDKKETKDDLYKPASLKRRSKETQRARDLTQQLAQKLKKRKEEQ